MNLIFFALRLVKRYDKYLMTKVSLCLMVVCICSVGSLKMVEILLNFLIANEHIKALISLGMLCILEGGKELCRRKSMKCELQIETILNEKVLPDIVKKVLHLQYDSFEKPETRDILHRISQWPGEKIQRYILAVLDIFQKVLLVFGYTIYICTFSLWLAGIYLIMLAGLVYTNWKSVQSVSDVLDAQTQEERRLSYVGGLLSNKNDLYELVTFGSVRYLIDKGYAWAEKMYKKRIQRTFRGQLWMIVNRVLLCLWFLLGITFVIRVAGDGKMGAALAFMNLLIDIVMISDEFAYGINRILLSSISVKQISLLMQLDEVETLRVERKDAIISELSVNDVVFSYPGSDKVVLNHVSLKIKKNEHVAIVGENGSGKSTLVKLLVGLYVPIQGEIYFQDIQGGKINTKECGKKLNVLFQDYGIYPITWKENMELGRSEYDPEKMQELIRKLGIKKIENKLDYLNGKFQEDSMELSGGEREKIALIRAMLIRHEFFIFDEPVASLDPEAESQFYAYIQNELKNCAGIVISHRLASAKLADRIIVLDHGEIVEEGTHDELMDKAGIYKRMFEKQKGWFVNEG